MKLVFMGSGAFALPALRALLDANHDVRALFTQPDRPAGRGHGLRMPVTKPLALERGIPVHQPARVRSEESVGTLREIGPECIVVVAYGQILPASILQIPERGIINVHGSLLPRYRGAAPVQWALAQGETETGVTTMLMDKGLDTGPILLQSRMPISDDDTGGTLEAKLATKGADLLVETLSRWRRRELHPRPQDDSAATLAPRLKKEDALVDFRRTAREIHLRVRAFDPWPVAHVLLEAKPLLLWKARLDTARGSRASPGQILGFESEGLVVACGEESRLVLVEVQPAGKTRMSAAAFARGRRLAVGDSLAS